MVQLKNIAYILQSIVLFVCLSTVLSCRGGTILDSGVLLEERPIILEAHNKLRASVAMGRVAGQPAAENMREMVWDDELAARAQEWANQCTFRHDPHRTIDRFTMGQNMAIIWSTEALAEDDGDFPSRIQNWFNEVQKYAFGSAWSPKTGHYSQLVWGETNLVGCGFTYYKTASRYNKLYVCNYGPGGNVIGYKPYETGKPSCRNHGMSPSTKYQGLCSMSTGGSQQNAIDTYSYKHSGYNTKTSYTASWQQSQPQQQQQGQYNYQRSYQQPQQQQQQQNQNQQRYQQNHNSDVTFKSFFKIYTPKPSTSSFGYNWNSRSQNHYNK